LIFFKTSLFALFKYKQNPFFQFDNAHQKIPPHNVESTREMALDIIAVNCRPSAEAAESNKILLP
jgi:hypothetical protein